MLWLRREELEATDEVESATEGAFRERAAWLSPGVGNPSSIRSRLASPRRRRSLRRDLLPVDCSLRPRASRYRTFRDPAHKRTDGHRHSLVLSFTGITP